MSRSSRRVLLGLARAAVFTAVWLVLTEGTLAGAPLALAAIGLATAVSLWLRPAPLSWSVAGLIGFVPFFLKQSVSGGMDVARRALAPGCPVAPDLIEYPVALPEGPARQFFTAVIGLLPGTLTAGTTPGGVIVHVLDRNLPFEQTLRELEHRTAALFNLPGREID